jgi:hypothetical protein
LTKDNEPANKAMDAMNALGCAWVVLAHTPRGDESHTFGSQMFDAAADVTVQLLTDDKSNETALGIGLRVDKANDIRKPKEVDTVSLEFDDFGIKSVQKAEASDFAEIASRREPTLAELIKEYVADRNMASVPLVLEGLQLPESKRSAVSKVLHSSGFEFTEKVGKEAFFRVKEREYQPVNVGMDMGTSHISPTTDHVPHNNEVVGTTSNYRESHIPTSHINVRDDEEAPY